MFGSYNSGDVLWLGDWGTPWILFFLLLGALVCGISYYDLRILSKLKCWTLVGLRVSVYLLAVLFLLEPAVDLKNTSKVKNQVAVLVDGSISMDLPSVQEGKKTRLEWAKEAVKTLNIPATKTDEEHVYSFFQFGDDLSPLALSENASATESKSNLGEALDAIKKTYAQKDLGGIVVLSDGVATGNIGGRTRRGEELDAITVAELKRLQAPVNTIAVGDASSLRDLAIVKVARDDFAFVHNKISIDVDVQAIGVKDTDLNATLSRDGKVVQTRLLKIRKGKSSYKLSFEFVPQKIGKEVYSIDLPHLENEALYENNHAQFLQKIIRDKIRALQVVGRPSWDERFLRRHLKQNPNVDLISFFILRTNQNIRVAGQDELSLIPFPTDELFQDELGSFDLVIFQNFNFGPYDMRRYLSEISKFVKEGGGFVMIGGDLSFSNGGYAETAISDILPVELSNDTNTIDFRPFKPRLTEAGVRHPITTLAFDPVENRKLWQELPDQKGTNIVLQAKPEASVLAVHPTLSFGGKPMPVVTISEAEEGRVMALTTDSTWRWGIERVGEGGTSREYQLFWNNAFRWLIKDPELKLIRIENQVEEYDVGSTTTLSVRVSNPDYTPAPNQAVKLTVDFEPFFDGKKKASKTVLSTEVNTDAGGLAQSKLNLTEAGVYKISVVSKTKAGVLKDKDVVIAVRSVAEFRDIIPRADLLKQIAETTGGTFTLLPDASPKLNLLPSKSIQVNRRKVIHLWDTSVAFLLLIGLLGLEWTLRRRWGRL